MIEKHIVRISCDVVYSGRDDSSAIRLAYTVTGDAVNLVTRPGDITKEYGADIIGGAGARNAVPEVELMMREIRECAGAYQPRRLENNQVFEL